MTMSCPDCGAPVDPNRDQLCRQCGYPLMFLRERPTGGETSQFGVARAPGESDAPAPAAHPILLEPVASATAPGASEIGCPACREINPATRIRCQRCGQELRPAQPGPVDLGPMPKPRRSFAWVAILAAVVAVVAIVAVVGFVVFRDRDEPTAQPPKNPSLIRVDRSAVTVSATASDPDLNLWGPQLTNDGDLKTAWHSGGQLIPTNIGVEVTFAFNRPVKLAKITIVNGYAKSPVDYTNNQRITKMLIRTDKGDREVAVVDSVEPQSFDVDGSVTNKVTLVVLATVPGTKFKDVCISEAVFDERV